MEADQPIAKFLADFLDSRQFPFRGFYTAPVDADDGASGRLIAGFASHGLPGPLLPKLSKHIANELGQLLARTRQAGTTQAPVPRAA